MCRRLTHRFCIVLVLALAGSASAALVLHLPFDEGSGDGTADISASGLQATLEREVQWTAGMFGSAVTFTDGYVEVVGDPLNLPQITVMAWVNPTTIREEVAPNWFQRSDLIYGKGGNNANDVIKLSLTAGDGVYFYVDAGPDNQMRVEDCSGSEGDEYEFERTDGRLVVLHPARIISA